MIHTQVLIVGGGPAGAACARTLMQQNINFIILDKAIFPRYKPCAGWLTPRIWNFLQIQAEEYPLELTRIDRFEISIRNIQFRLNTVQYAVRRIEFDNWLIGEVSPNLVQHNVQNIDMENGEYVIDEKYSAPFLIGGGGTNCPVRKKFFNGQKSAETLIVAQEEEFTYPYTDERCHLWFLKEGLSGYAWYFPKVNGVVNVGVGGSAIKLNSHHDSLKRHWRLLEERLETLGLVRGYQYKPAGHSYRLRTPKPVVQKGNILLIGDALGLATLDMGEGITPSIESGILAAQAIIQHKPYNISGIPRFSFPSLLGIRK